MNISWLTLRDLQYLVAVADHEHFGKAAAACNVSQPALSAQMFPLFFEPFVLAAPRDHPLASKGRLTRRDLNSEHMILLEDGHCLRGRTLNLCPANRRGHIRQFHATSLETLRHLVATGSGYTLVPALAVREEKELKPLIRYRQFEDKEVGRNVMLKNLPPAVQRAATAG